MLHAGAGVLQQLRLPVLLQLLLLRVLLPLLLLLLLLLQQQDHCQTGPVA
jgi:hypothetical protein